MVFVHCTEVMVPQNIYSRSYSSIKLFFITVLISSILSIVLSCNRKSKPTPPTPSKSIKMIEGSNQPVPEDSAQRGEVLISYSDCYQCHAKDKKIVGPAFESIAKRYPANDTFITMLSQRIISGGNGVWGYPAMAPHPQISDRDARLMVQYILSIGR